MLKCSKAIGGNVDQVFDREDNKINALIDSENKFILRELSLEQHLALLRAIKNYVKLVSCDLGEKVAPKSE